LIVESEKNLLADVAEVIAENGRQFLAMWWQEPAAPKPLCDQRRYMHGALLLEGKYIMFLRSPTFCPGFLLWNLTCVKYLAGPIS